MTIHLNSLKKRLGDILVDVGIITPAQLKNALETQKITGEKLGSILAQQEVINEEVMLAFLGKQCGVSYVSLSEYGEVSEDIINSIPESIARKQTLIPIAKENNTITVAMADPFNIFALDDIKLMTGHDVEIVIASENEIKEAIEKYYIRNQGLAMSIDFGKLKNASEETVLNALLAEAVKSRLTDMHIEPQFSSLRIRIRVNGVLQELPSFPKELHAKLTARIKSMANKDSSVDSYLPWEGQVKVVVDGKNAEFKVSGIQTTNGERITLQLLPSGYHCLDLSKLGFETETLAAFKKHIDAKSGFIIITSPKNSGKTTTLYATLSYINRPDKNIFAIEEGSSCEIEGITQIQARKDDIIEPAQLLRSFDQHNPDVIIVDEMHDYESTKHLMNTAINGRLVLSTFPIDSTAGVITHLNNMGIEPFLTSSVLAMVLSQRLMRTVCLHCKSKYEISTKYLLNIGIDAKLLKGAENIELWRGKGCDKCNHTGYVGTVAIYELLEPNEKLRSLILDRASEATLKQSSIDSGLLTIRDAAWKKVVSGVSTIEEMLRITKLTD